MISLKPAAVICRSTKSILAYFCDPELRAQVRNIGEEPDTLPKTYARLLNDTIAGRPDDMVVCMHLCRGNFAGAWVAEGGYDPIAELLFNEIAVDGYFLEYDTAACRQLCSAADSFRRERSRCSALSPPRARSSRPRTSSSAASRRRAATRRIEQLALSPQCGFSSGIGGNAMTVDDEIAKLKLVVETAREVWGTA